MTFAKASALTVALLAAVALGIWIGPHVTRGSAAIDLPGMVAGARSASAAAADRTPEARRATRPEEAVTSSVPLDAPALQARLKPLLKYGTDMTLAADGFKDAGEFAAIAHASNNTDVPFVVLKHRVLDEKKTLAAAIHESKPQMDARLEAQRAWAEARSDVAQLES